MRAIVMDDSKAIRTILQGFLRDLGFDVAGAADGLEALNYLKQSEKIDLALVDWNMPQMNGLDFVENVRSNSAFDTIRLMMVTTETEMSQVIKAIDAGADEYVMKPFTKEIIAEKLRIVGLIS